MVTATVTMVVMTTTLIAVVELVNIFDDGDIESNDGDEEDDDDCSDVANTESDDIPGP